MATPVSAKIVDQSVASLHNQCKTAYNAVQKQAKENLKEYENSAATFKAFEAKVESNDRLYQEATESFTPTEGIVEELKTCLQEYQGYKTLLAKVSLQAQSISRTMDFLKPSSRSISDEKDLEINAPDLYQQVKESDKICLERLNKLQTSLESTLSLKTRLTEQVNHPKITSSLQRFLGIVDNQGKPLSKVARTFSDAALLKSHTQHEMNYEAIKYEIATVLPELRKAVSGLESFTKNARSEGHDYQNATKALDPNELKVALATAQKYCKQFQDLSDMCKKVDRLEKQISKTIEFLIPNPRSQTENERLQKENQQLYVDTQTSEDICNGYVAELRERLTTIKDLKTQLINTRDDNTTRWAIVRICEIVKNGGQPLSLMSRSWNYLSSSAVLPTVPKPEEVKLPEPKLPTIPNPEELKLPEPKKPEAEIPLS